MPPPYPTLFQKIMHCCRKLTNYEVALAGNAAEGLHLAQSENFDMVLLETRLPDQSGFELCKQICGVPGHAPVVFVSADAYETDIQRGSQAGAIAYLTKPLDFAVLEITLTRLLAKSLEKGLEKNLKGSGVATTHEHLAAVW